MSINLTPEELEAMLDRAARRGACEALKSMGLQDEDARRDIHRNPPDPSKDLCEGNNRSGIIYTLRVGNSN